MTRIALALLASTMLAAPVAAVEPAKPGARDPRIRTVPYQADNAVEMHATVGAALTVQFADTETVVSVGASDRDKEHIDIAPDGSLLFLKAKVPLPIQPLFVRTQRANGASRLYVFQWDATEGTADVTAPNATYLVRFTYPAEAQTARAEAWRRGAVARAERAAQAALTAAPGLSAPNYRYVAQGARGLAPETVWDDGLTTFLRFPGNVRLPAFYVIGPDNKEALANYSVEGGTVSIHQTGPHFRLRDGDTVLDLWNRGWNPVGTNPGTGTTSPDVQRVLKASAR